MNKVIFLISVILITFWSGVNCQTYKAYDYWKMEQDSLYNSVRIRMVTHGVINDPEREYYQKYKASLDAYFEKMGDDEKSFYFRYRSSWQDKTLRTDKPTNLQEQEVFSGEKSTYTKYVINSGFFGAYYGMSAVMIFEIENEVTAAVPMITAGAAVMLPLLTIKSDRVTYSSLKLSQHGKLIGLIDGLAIGMILSGKEDTDEKLILASSTLGSISMGYFGYLVGKQYHFTQGEAALYSYYGTLMSMEGAAFAGAFDINDRRVIGSSVLAGSAAGYLLANRLSERYTYTPGDITSMKAFTCLNALLGFGILRDIDNHYMDNTSSSVMLIPIVTTLGGSLLSNLWLKNSRLTVQQGRNTALAAGAGAIIGIGLESIINPDPNSVHYIIPYISGVSSYTAMLYICSKINRPRNSVPENNNKLNLSIMPQNILLNRKYGKSPEALGRGLSFPVVTATYKF
jgi:hypothetical protein